ncbi:hypothetical protein WQ57_16345 [Mesobacillus campisalis]|uniref:Uncharacterized protein n=1 Tax=Mesobacillus campisalis TaxID=1408103 RepID=A0A0M2SS25_9BACI|nr:hypothetical protein [Mesobacillus campisalis]KKK36953.1 hypothetical protein WQ57_16345 [Mesobacillus campisalis]
MADSGERELAEESYLEEGKETVSENRMSIFDRIMFGPGRTEGRQQEDPSIFGDVNQGHSQNQINLEEIMVHIDTLVDSARQLKPMFSKIRPFFDQFLKK